MRFGKPSHVLDDSERWHIQYLKNIALAMTLLTLLLALGASGFMMIEGWNVFDSVYMTVITLSTVGFGEIHPLSQEGKIFCTLLIMVGMLVVTYCFSTLGTSILQGELRHFGRIHRMERAIKRFQDHIIVCGYGRLSQCVIPELLEQGEKVVVVEFRKAALEELRRVDIPYVPGNAFEDHTLITAGIKNAKALLTLLPDDANNVFVVLTARALNDRVRIVSRIETPEVEKKLRQAGANQVIAPYRVGSTRLVQQLLHPYVNDFLEILSGYDGDALVLEQVVVGNESPLIGKTLMESKIREKAGVLIAAILNKDGTLDFKPTGDTELAPGATLVAMGMKEDIEKLDQMIEA